MLRADLHVHTVLSPCAEYRMVPALIVERAEEVGIDLVAITDHNSGENAAAVMRAASPGGTSVLPGMEVESREGVHLLAIFDTVEALSIWQDVVYAALPERKNVERLFGTQLVVDQGGNLLSVNRRLLSVATSLSVEQVVAGVEQGGGLCIPAHVDRTANGLLGVLGMVPNGLTIHALEISPNHTPVSARRMHPNLEGRTLIQSSDAHRLEEIGSRSTRFLVEESSVQELTRACRGELGRAVVW